MNEEYLWSKKGSDSEIERLEGLLSEFCLEPGETPVLPFETAEESAGFVTRRFAWILGFATPSFALALFGFWFFASNSPGDLQVHAIQSGDLPVQIREDFVPAMPIIVSTEGRKAPTKSRRWKATPSKVKTVYRTRRSMADRAGSLTAIRLTSEEKYAYDRLMLALSIAGTKLRVVQDAVDGNTGKDLIRNTK